MKQPTEKKGPGTAFNNALEQTSTNSKETKKKKKKPTAAETAAARQKLAQMRLQGNVYDETANTPIGQGALSVAAMEKQLYPSKPSTPAKPQYAKGTERAPQSIRRTGWQPSPKEVADQELAKKKAEAEAKKVAAAKGKTAAQVNKEGQRLVNLENQFGPMDPLRTGPVGQGALRGGELSSWMYPEESYFVPGSEEIPVGVRRPVWAKSSEKVAAEKKAAAEEEKRLRDVERFSGFHTRQRQDIEKYYPGLTMKPPEGMSVPYYKWATEVAKMSPDEAVAFYKTQQKHGSEKFIEPDDDDWGATRLIKGATNTAARTYDKAKGLYDVTSEEVGDRAWDWLTMSPFEYKEAYKEKNASPDRALNKLIAEENKNLARYGIYAQGDGTYIDDAGETFSGISEAMFEGGMRGMGGETPKVVMPEIFDAYAAEKAAQLEEEKAAIAGTPDGQTVTTSGAKTEEEAKEVVDATNSEVAAPPSAQQEQEKNDNKKTDGKSTSEAAVDGGETASGDENPNAGDKIRQEGGSEEDALKADYVEYNVPKGMMTEPLRKQLNTMPPATEAETGLFESTAFQTSLLTFGLAMLMGKDSNDALRIAGNAYYQENYKTTQEYKDFKKYNVPDSIIYQAVATDDWTEVQKWYDNGKKAWDEQEKARIEAMNPFKDLGSTQEVVLKDILGRHKVLTKSMEDIWMAGNMAAQYREALKNGDDIDGLDGILMMNVMQRFIDPNATVRGEDVALIEARRTFPQWARTWWTNVVSHLDPADEQGFKDAFKKLPPNEMNQMVSLIERGVATQMKAARQVMQDYTAEAYNSGIGPQWHSWNQGRFANFRTQYEMDVESGLFDDKKKK